MWNQFSTGQMLHGGDYNPEQWLEYPEILEEDIIRLKEAHCNTVTLGVFSWAFLEPAEGEYHFKWMEQCIERLYENGIRVILATPSGARPRWMAQKYPEVLREDSDRRRNLFGERHNHCYTSPVYRKKIREMDRRLSERFGSHPAVILWHISNELGGECHCPLCQEAFRGWLKERYGTVEELNRRWCTAFWSHTYQSFDQVESPSGRGDQTLHGLNLDWKRFVTHQTLQFALEEISAVREGGSKLPTTANLMYYYDGLDYHKFAEVFDVLSWDNYPTWHKGAEAETALDSGMYHDIIRSVQKRPFLLMESCPSSTNWQAVSKLKRPRMQTLSSLQAVAHGSDSVLYFQIRQSRGSSEKFHGAVIDHYGGSDTRVFQEVAETGKALERLSEVCGSQVHSEAAIIYSWENRWALQDAQGPRNQNLCGKETIQKSYRALRRLGCNVDLIGMDQEISSYRIVAAPMLYLFADGFAQKVKSYVENGGIFVMTYWSGIVDSNDRCFLGGTPHGLMEVMGLRQAEIDALYDGESNCFLPAGDGRLQKNYQCQNLCQLLEIRTAKPLMVYGEDFYQGSPAVTENAFGSGKAYYVAADAEEAFYRDFYEMLAKEAQLTLPILSPLPDGVEVMVREAVEARYIFVQNFRSDAVSIPKPEGAVLLYGPEGSELPSWETQVWKAER